MTVLTISVLGPLQIQAGEQLLSHFETNKARALLAYLAIECHFPHSRESLAELLWPESSPESSFGNLRYALVDVRRVIGDASAHPPYLNINRDSLQFNQLSSYEMDSDRLDTLLKTSDIKNQKDAINLFRGDFLQGFPSINSNPFDEWVAFKREQFRRKMVEALRLVADHHQGRGEYKIALPYAYRQVELEPWLEEAHQQVMRLLALDGQRSAALAQYDTCRRSLKLELDLDPSDEITSLYETIRDGGLGSPRLGSASAYDKLLFSLNKTRPEKSNWSTISIPTIGDSLTQGKKAAQEYAYEEAVTHYHHGLNLLDSLPDNPEKQELELQIQIAMGAALLSIRNISSSEVAQAYQRAYEICRKLGNHAGLFYALKALTSYYTLCGDIHAGLDIGQRLMKIAEQTQDEEQLIIAHNNRGITQLYAGNFISYKEHAQKLLELYNDDDHHHLASIIGYDPKVATLSHSIGLWMLGYPDQALACVRLAVDWGEQIRHPFSKCYARFFLAHIHILRREYEDTLLHAETLLLLAKKICNSFWFAQGLIAKGWALAQMGKPEEGLDVLSQGFSIIRGAGSTFVLCASAAWLCDVCGMAGKPAEGLSILEEFINKSSKAGILHMMSANYQSRGELLLKLSKLKEAESSFKKAIEIARHQKAKGWELRATMSLSCLWMRQGKTEAAHHCLWRMVEWFREGFDTADLTEAKALLMH